MKKLKFLIVPIVGTAFMITGGQADATQISLLPAIQKQSPGNPFFVDIYISGLHSGGTNSLLGGWTMDIGYDTAVLQPLLITNVLEGPYLGSIAQGEAMDFPAPDYSASSVITLGELSLLPIDNYLDGIVWKRGLDCVQRQPQCDPDPGNGNPGGSPLDSFRLASVGFRVSDTASLGQFTTISTANIVLSDGNGNAISVDNNPNAQVFVPEPNMLAMFGVGISLLLGFYRFRGNAGFPRITRTAFEWRCKRTSQWN